MLLYTHLLIHLFPNAALIFMSFSKINGYRAYYFTSVLLSVLATIFLPDKWSLSYKKILLNPLLAKMKALKCGTLGASFGKPCASSYVEGILDEYIHSIVRMLLSGRRQLFLVGAVEI